MSLVDIVLPRRQRLESPRPVNCQPRVEQLEERQCLTVAAPTTLTATALSATQITVSWSDVSGELGYRVFQWSGTQAVQIASLGPNELSYTVNNLKGNTPYYFNVESFDATSAARSYWALAWTSLSPIAAPSSVRVTNNTATSLSVQWGNAMGATGYNLYGWDGAHSYLIATTSSQVTSYNVQNLRPGTTYYYYVQSFNDSNRASSPWVSGTTLVNTITAPTNSTAQAFSTSGVNLAWTNVPAAAGYKVFVWNGQSGSSPVLLATLPAIANGYQASGLLPGTTYQFSIQSFNGVSTATTPWVTATTFSAAVFAAPTNVTATVASEPHIVILTWTEPARAAGYQVYHWSGYGWTLVNMVTAGTHSLTIAGLASGQKHWFYVMAYTATGEVSLSASVSVVL